MSLAVVSFLEIFIPLFVVIDPFGTLVLFMAATSDMSPKERRLATKDAVVYGSLILVFFAVLGNVIIFFFGISIQALEIAGGIILLIMGIEMVREGDKPKSTRSSNGTTDVGIVPFATPLLAGPGAISLVIILMKNGLMEEIFTLMSILVVFLIVYIFFTYSLKIMDVVGERPMKALTRIFGLLVAAFAIQYFIDAMTGLGLIK
ncbi:membrane protein [uncultured archaeon]|nr:membrane protein [uncultured archaeon]HKJ96944.1 MarC family protein [Thermoplasmataceae archaeon]